MTPSAVRYLTPTLCFCTLLALLSSSSVASQSLDVASIPRPTLIGTHLSWPTQRTGATLRITSPSDAGLEWTFEPGDAPSVSLTELAVDGVLEDGGYKVAMYFESASDPEGKAIHPDLLRTLRSQDTWFGVIHVRGGSVQPMGPDLAPSPERKTKQAAGDASGLQTIRSEAVVDIGQTPFIHFEDTTGQGSGSETNWVAMVDSPAAGDGDSDFVLYSFDEDTGSATNFDYPFVIENNAPTNSLYVAEDTGFVGLGTNAPESNLHITDGFPRVRFDRTSGTANDWILTAGEPAFTLGNATQGTFPILVHQDAANVGVYLTESTLFLGVGEKVDLHIFGQGDQDVFSGMGFDLSSGPAFNFGYSGASFGVGSGFLNVRPTASAVAPNPALYFMTNNVDRMVVDRDGEIGVDMDNQFGNTFDPAHPIHAQLSGAYLSAAGVWTNASSRALKENIAPLGLDLALQTLAALEPVRYNYLVEPDDPQVGFIAEDVPELVATPRRKALAPMDIVGVLTRVVQEQQQQLESLRREVEDLRQSASTRR